MERTYWHRQTADSQLFPDLHWSRPENKHAAGKLLIVGGNAHGFTAPATAYQEAIRAGIGSAKVLLPDALQKTLGRHIETAEFAPSTPVSGSFAKSALGEMLELARWADAVLLAGDFGRNSETAVLLESFVRKYQGPLTVTRDTADNFYHIPDVLLKREQTLLVLSFAQLQKLASAARFTKAFTFSMDLLNLIDVLHRLSHEYPCTFVVKHLETIIVSRSGQVSTTRLSAERPIWRVAAAAHAAVWWLQHITKPYEAITASILQIDQYE